MTQYRGAWQGAVCWMCLLDGTFLKRSASQLPGVGSPHKTKRKKSQRSKMNIFRWEGSGAAISHRSSRAASPRSPGPPAGSRSTRHSPPLESPSPTGSGYSWNKRRSDRGCFRKDFWTLSQQSSTPSGGITQPDGFWVSF